MDTMPTPDSDGRVLDGADRMIWASLASWKARRIKVLAALRSSDNENS